MLLQILTNGERMFIEDVPYEEGELQVMYLVEEDKGFLLKYLELEKIPYSTLCLLLATLVADGDLCTLRDLQEQGCLELQREEVI